MEAIGQAALSERLGQDGVFRSTFVAGFTSLVCSSQCLRRLSGLLCQADVEAPAEGEARPAALWALPISEFETPLVREAGCRSFEFVFGLTGTPRPAWVLGSPSHSVCVGQDGTETKPKAPGSLGVSRSTLEDEVDGYWTTQGHCCRLSWNVS